LRADLTQFKTDLDAAEVERKKEDQAEIAERRDYVTELLSRVPELLEEFHKAHEEMAKELRDALARIKPALEASESERKEMVQSELAAVKAEIEEAARAWKKLISQMSSIRRKVTITGPAEIKAAVKVTAVEEAVEEDEAEEETGSESLNDQILDLLDDNPDGLRMVEIADALNIPSWRSLIPVMKELLDEGDVTKEDSTYYLV